MGERLKKAVTEDELPDPNAELAAKILTALQPGSAEDIRELYTENGHEHQIDSVQVETHKPSVSVLHLSELLLGYRDSDVEFYLKSIERIAELPEDMKPDVIVMSGLMQGDFRYSEKNKRPTLVEGLTTMNAQLKYARQMLEALQTIDRPIIYNLSNDDRRIAEDNTQAAFLKMEKLAKSELGSGWVTQNRLKQSPHWNALYNFQIKEALPYCIRAGRDLYTADEMSMHTGGAIAISEYLVLSEIKEAEKEGRRIPTAYVAWREKVRTESLSEEDVIIVDDFNMNIKTEGQEYTDWIRHYMTLSAPSMPVNHMAIPLSTVAHLAANGDPSPNMLVTGQYHEEAGVFHHAGLVASTGGLVDPKRSLNTSGRSSAAPGDLSRRLLARKRISSPSASIHERTDDGRHIVTFMNDKLYEKAFSIPERMTIAELCDLQTGSITARPDLLAKYLDYLRTRTIGERATAIFFGGDMLHGRNYPHFASESQQTGLMAMDSQEAFVTALFRGAFDDVTVDELEAITKILVQPGNHEWNSGTLTQHGYSFTTYMRELFGRMYARVGYSDAEIDERIKTHEAVITRKGEYATDFTGVERFGDIGVLIRHYLLDRGGKGSGGGPPVYQTDSFAKGGGDLMEDIDVFMAGHWHHPQYAMVGDKLGIVGGSMAGISGYELSRGYRAFPAGTLLHIGGGLPPQLEVVPEQALHHHTITKGEFTPDSLLERGFRDDDGFDPERHGIFLPDGEFPKSALQKAILLKMREASQRKGRTALL
jgi:hypothetical protein